jgi:3-ketoacyl-CoA synthase
MAVLALILWYIDHREKPTYLLNFACFEPPESWKLSPEQLLNIMRLKGCYTEDSLNFMAKIMENSGVGPKTAWPPGICRVLEGQPQDTSTEAAREESRVSFYRTL